MTIKHVAIIKYIAIEIPVNVNKHIAYRAPSINTNDIIKITITSKVRSRCKL